MAKSSTRRSSTAKKAPIKKSISKNANTIARPAAEREKNAFEKNFGEGTAFDLDYGKLLIIALCIYIAVQVT